MNALENDVAKELQRPPIVSAGGDTRCIRVLHLTLQLDTGGMEKLLVEFARHVDRSRFQLHFVSMTTRGAVAEELEALGWPVHALEIPPGLRPQVVMRLARLFREWEIDVAHFHNTKPLIYGAPAARLAGVTRTVYTRHGQRHNATRGQDLLFRLACRFVDDVACVSKDSAECSIHQGVDQSKIRIIWNGINLSRFAGSGPVAGGPLVMVGRLSREKDVETLLDAVALAHRAEPGLHLEIAGDGECRQDLEKKASELGLAGGVVRFLGTVRDVTPLLERASMFVLSSLTEGISIAILEAMASGLPVVATRVGGNPELVVDGQTGYLVPARDPASLAEAILKMWRDPERAGEMGAQGRRRVEAHFDSRRMVRAYERLYIGAAGRPRGSKERRLGLKAMRQSIHRNVLLPGFETLYKRRRTFSYLKQLNRSQWLSREQLDQIQLGNLKQLLLHASANCPYYRNEWQAKGLDPTKLQSLEQFRQWPVIDRATIGANRMQMRAQSAGMKLMSKSTGGSSGQPLHFDLNHDSYDRRCAASHRGYEWAGAPPGAKLLYLWGVPLGTQPRAQQIKDRLYHALYRRSLLNCFELSDSRVTEFFERHNACRPDVVVAYTNALYEFARSLRERGLRPYRPRSIIVGAEKLHPFQRELIEEVFGAPVFETYGSREFMLIAAECDRHEGLHLSHEHLLVEILNDDGTPTPPGQEGNVAITDLFNYGMPFIRYLNGDRGVAGFSDCSCGRGLPLIKPILGRVLDVLTTPEGGKLPGEFFPHLLKDFAAVKRFQVVQDDPTHVQIRIVAGSGWTDSDRTRIESAAGSALGPRVRCEVALVPDISLTAVGKLRVVVNKCAPSRN